jgi:hypothetical protein
LSKKNEEGNFNQILSLAMLKQKNSLTLIPEKEGHFKKVS